MANINSMKAELAQRHPQRDAAKMDATSQVAGATGDKRPTEPKEHVRADTQKPLNYKLEKAQNWAIKIKGKPGYHPVKDVVDTGAGNQNSYRLHDGTMVPHAHVEDLDMNFKKPAPKLTPGTVVRFKKALRARKEKLAKAKQAPDGPNLWSKHVHSMATDKKPEEAKNEKLEKASLADLKAQYRPPQEPTLADKVKEIKEKYREPKPKTLKDQVTEIKNRYKGNLKKTLAERLTAGTLMPRVAVVGVMDNGKLLMGKRLDSGKYTFPAGHANPGEHPDEAARRELFEETGLKPEHIHPLGRKVMIGADGRHRMIHAYICRAPHAKATGENDPDGEVSKWESVPIVKGRLPRQIEGELHIPPQKNILIQLLNEAH